MRSMNAKKEIKTIDQYIKTKPPNVQVLLQQLRKAIHEAAPQAQEIISYQMPAFKQNKVLVYFGGFKDHIGFFPTSSGIKAFENKLGLYKTGKGTIQFPLDQPLPLDLVKEVVHFRLKESSTKKN